MPIEISDIPKGITKQKLQAILAGGEVIRIAPEQYLFSYKDEKPNLFYIIFYNTDTPKFFLITMNNIIKIINGEHIESSWLTEINPNKPILKVATEINPECEWLYSFYFV